MRGVYVLLLGGVLVAGCRPPEVSISETPVKFSDERPGHGQIAQVGDVVSIDYRVLLPDGSVVLRDDDFHFELGGHAVIAGFDEAVPGMRAGGRRVVACPPQKHWGRKGYGPIPPNTTLTLVIELNAVE